MKPQYYVTESDPNGTAQVLVIDSRGDTHVIDEAVFGLMPRTKPVEITVDWSAEPFLVYQTSLPQVLRHIACSPVSDGTRVVRELRSIGCLQSVSLRLTQGGAA